VQLVLQPDGALWLVIGDCDAGMHTSVVETLSKSGLSMGVPSVERLTSLSTTPEAIAGVKPKDLVGIQWRVALGSKTTAGGCAAIMSGRSRIRCPRAVRIGPLPMHGHKATPRLFRSMCCTASPRRPRWGFPG
jgi:hypothetical protein